MDQVTYRASDISRSPLEQPKIEVKRDYFKIGELEYKVNPQHTNLETPKALCSLLEQKLLAVSDGYELDMCAPISPTKTDPIQQEIDLAEVGYGREMWSDALLTSQRTSTKSRAKRQKTNIEIELEQKTKDLKRLSQLPSPKLSHEKNQCAAQQRRLRGDINTLSDKVKYTEKRNINRTSTNHTN